MKRFILPLIGILAALWAAYSVVRTQPRRDPTDPPASPAVSDFKETVAAVGLIPRRPAPDLCWYWADPYRNRGYWDYCY